MKVIYMRSEMEFMSKNVLRLLTFPFDVPVDAAVSKVIAAKGHTNYWKKN
jgi:hypothetical protein